MKIAVITCYFDPDYVRARTLRAALKSLPGVKTVVVKNKHKGVLRYFEIIPKLIALRRNEKPDAYLLTFRGQEILPLVLLVAFKKPVWFDEFIVPIAYATGEHHARSFATVVKHTLARMSEKLYRRWLQRCKVIFADTATHAELSARAARLNLRKYVPVPVGADEKLFKLPAQAPAESGVFTVFFYGNMLPLHGVNTIFSAIEELKDTPSIRFVMAGGKKQIKQRVDELIKIGASIDYRPWIPFNELPATTYRASLCLGGPFGNTQQAHHVVTGKTYQFLACGRPVVVGAGEATDEYFVDKENSLVVPQADVEALVKAIRWAYLHPDELKTIAASGRKLYEKQFSTTAIARRLQPLVEAEQ